MKFTDPPSQEKVSYWVIVLIIVVEFSWTIDTPLSVDDISATSWQTIAKLIIYLLAGLVAFVRLLRNKPLLLSNRFPELIYIGLLFIGFFTSLISPAITTSLAVELSMICMFLIIKTQKINSIYKWISIYYGLGLVVLSSTIAYFLAPNQFSLLDGSGLIRIRGIIGHPNGLGKAIVEFLILSHYLTPRLFTKKIINNYLKWILIFLSIVILFMTNSKTSIIIYLAVFSTSILFEKWVVLKKKLSATLLLIIYLLFAFIALFLISSMGITSHDILKNISRSGEISEVLSLTGRTDVWQTAIMVIQDYPLGVGWRGGYILLPKYWFEYFGYGTWFPAHSHNMYLETMLTLGISGFLLFITLIVSCFSGHLRTIYNPDTYPGDKKAAFLSLLSLLIVLLVGITERSAVGNVSIFHVVFLVIITSQPSFKKR